MNMGKYQIKVKFNAIFHAHTHYVRAWWLLFLLWMVSFYFHQTWSLTPSKYYAKYISFFTPNLSYYHTVTSILFSFITCYPLGSGNIFHVCSSLVHNQPFRRNSHCLQLYHWFDYEPEPCEKLSRYLLSSNPVFMYHLQSTILPQ